MGFLQLLSKIILIGLLLVDTNAEESQTRSVKGLQNVETDENWSSSHLFNREHNLSVESKPLYVAAPGTPRPTRPSKETTHPRNYSPQYPPINPPHYPPQYPPINPPHYPPQYQALSPPHYPPLYPATNLPHYPPPFPLVYPPIYEPMSTLHYYPSRWSNPQYSPNRPPKRPRPSHYDSDDSDLYYPGQRPPPYRPSYTGPQEMPYIIVISPPAHLYQHHHRNRTRSTTSQEELEEEDEQPIMSFNVEHAPKLFNLARAPELFFHDDHEENIDLLPNRLKMYHRIAQQQLQQRNSAKEKEDAIRADPDIKDYDDVNLQDSLHLLAEKLASRPKHIKSSEQRIRPLMLETLLHELIDERRKRVREREAEIYIRNYITNRKK